MLKSRMSMMVSIMQYVFFPAARWEDIVGFGDAEIQEYQKVIEASAEQITRLAASGKG